MRIGPKTDKDKRIRDLNQDKCPMGGQTPARKAEGRIKGMVNTISAVRMSLAHALIR